MGIRSVRWMVRRLLFHEFSVTENLRLVLLIKDLNKLNGESDVTKPMLIPANNRTVSMPYKVIKGDCNGDDDFSDLNLFGRSCASPIGSVKEPSPIMTACNRNSPVIE